MDLELPAVLTSVLRSTQPTRSLYQGLQAKEHAALAAGSMVKGRHIMFLTNDFFETNRQDDLFTRPSTLRTLLGWVIVSCTRSDIVGAVPWVPHRTNSEKPRLQTYCLVSSSSLPS